jgi:hypothetical protein
VQALDSLDPASYGFRKCLRELRHICGTKTILPTSYILSSSLLNIGRHPVASGGPGDVYEGTLNGLKVCVKRIRVYSRDGPKKVAKVRYRHDSFPCLPTLTRTTDALSRGSGVETLGPPKHRPPPRHHFHSPSACLGVDVRRRPHGTHHEAPRRESTWARRFQFCRV